MPANEAVWELLMLAHRQWRCGAFGPIGLDYGAIFEMARALGIPIDRLLLEKISLYEEEILRERGGKESAETCDGEKESECRRQYGDLFDAVCRKCTLRPAKGG